MGKQRPKEIDLSAFDSAIKSDKSIDLSAFDNEVKKKRLFAEFTYYWNAILNWFK